MGFIKLDLLRYILSTNLCVISTVSPQGAPEAALVGIATTDDHRVIFDRTTTTRKHANLLHSPAAALVIAGAGEKALHYDGKAMEGTSSGGWVSAVRYQSGLAMA